LRLAAGAAALPAVLRTASAAVTRTSTGEEARL